MNYFRKLKQVNLLFLLKTGIGSAIAIILAEGLGFAYSPSAGIITLLTIQNTKRETIFIALRRMEAFILAVILSFLTFQSIGYTAIAFGAFVFIFVALCILLGLKDGISMNAVLMTHFLIEKKMDIPLIINEIALLLIGMGLGILLNLIMPRYREKIRKEQIDLEELMKLTLQGLGIMLKEKDSCLLQGESIYQEREITPQEGGIIQQREIIASKDVKMQVREVKPLEKVLTLHEIEITAHEMEIQPQVSKLSPQEKRKAPQERELVCLSRTETNARIMNLSDKTYEDVDFTELETFLEELLKKAYEDAGNTLLSNTKYLVSYLEMRKLQIGVLKDIKDNIKQIPVLLRQTYPIAEFLEHTASSFHELNNAKGLLNELKELQEHFRKEKLPETREEFEYRAILFQILKELEYFLLLKRNFMKELEAKNMKSYWSQ
jgi:uncharacterized membrane protein YgaE (UPF0421/DUF939 family)